MRRCDVCGAIIPSGSSRCPNCGQRYKTNRKSVEIKSQSKFVDEKKDSRGVSKFLIIFSSIVLLLGILGIGITVMISRSVFQDENPQIEIVSETYYDYESFLEDFEEEAFKVSAYNEFLDNVIEKYHNDEYLFSVSKEFYVDHGQFSDSCMVADIVYRHYEVMIQLNYSSDGNWELQLSNRLSSKDNLIASKDILRMFADVAGVKEEAMSALYDMFQQEFEGKDYSSEYYLGQGTVNFGYFDGNIHYSINQIIDL